MIHGPKFPWKMELNQTDLRRRRAHFSIDQPAAHLLRAQRTSPSQESRKEPRGREGGKESTESSCLLLPDAPKGAALSSRGQSGSVRQLLTNYVAACLSTVHFPACGWHRNRRKLDGRGEIEKVKIWGMAGRNKTKWSKAER